MRLRCMRCGEWHEREVGDPYWPELCASCCSKAIALLFEDDWPHAGYERWVARYMRGHERHPTWVRLQHAWAEFLAAREAAWDAPW